MSELYKIKGFDLTADGLEVHVHMGPTTARLKKAHRNLKVNIMNAMMGFMPIRNGDLIGKTETANTLLLDDERMYAAAGTDANGVPYGKFQYEGKVMIGEETGSPFARKNEKKVVTDRSLDQQHGGHPYAVPHWFEVAWKKYGKRLIGYAQDDLEGK